MFSDMHDETYEELAKVRKDLRKLKALFQIAMKTLNEIQCCTECGLGHPEPCTCCVKESGIPYIVDEGLEKIRKLKNNAKVMYSTIR